MVNSGLLLSWDPRRHVSQLESRLPWKTESPDPQDREHWKAPRSSFPRLSALRHHNFQVKSRTCVDFLTHWIFRKKQNLYNLTRGVIQCKAK